MLHPPQNSTRVFNELVFNETEIVNAELSISSKFPSLKVCFGISGASYVGVIIIIAIEVDFLRVPAYLPVKQTNNWSPRKRNDMLPPRKRDVRMRILFTESKKPRDYVPRLQPEKVSTPMNESDVGSISFESWDV
mmetsp:Transcript_21494/g.34547  ORF Transcript_21494/g.34547 Transcript_21494/m.34547 type:complete len:135 (-) Transcript_21494:1468-1872(-)